jgi:ADP-heptose:LPS heptosyltransferase
MKILISISTGMGNLLLKLPLLQQLHRQGHELILMDHAEPWTIPILEMAQLPKPRSWPARSKNEFLSSRKSLPNCDLALIPFDSTLKGLEWAITGKSRRIIQHTPPRGGKKFLLLKLLSKREWVPVPIGRHETQLNFDLAQAAKLDFDRQAQTQLVVPHFPPPTLNPYLVIQPGAANGTLGAKVWAKKNFEELMDAFLAKWPEASVVLVGDSGDHKALGETAERWKLNRIVNLMGKTSVPQLAATIKQAKLVLCHDSGVMHLANTLQTPLIALYGPTDEQRTAPLGPSSHLIFSAHETRGAMQGFKTTEAELSKRYPRNECLESITANRVLDKITELWA